MAGLPGKGERSDTVKSLMSRSLWSSGRPVTNPISRITCGPPQRANRLHRPPRINFSFFVTQAWWSSGSRSIPSGYSCPHVLPIMGRFRSCLRCRRKCRYDTSRKTPGINRQEPDFPGGARRFPALQQTGDTPTSLMREGVPRTGWSFP